MKKGILTLVVLLAVFTGCSTPAADLVLKNGQVYTLEENLPWASTVVITGYQSRRSICHAGFYRSHVHFAGYAAQLHDIQLMPDRVQQKLMGNMSSFGLGSCRAYYFIFNNPIISKVLGPSISFEKISGRQLPMTQG